MNSYNSYLGIQTREVLSLHLSLCQESIQDFSILSLLLSSKGMRRDAEGEDAVRGPRFPADSRLQNKAACALAEIPCAPASSGPSAPLLISDSQRKMGHRQQIVVWTNLFLAVNQPDSTLNLDD